MNERDYIDNETLTHGRQTIYSATDDVNEKNIVDIVNKALSVWCLNLWDEQMLYWYRRGLTPIVNRQKERNKFINNKINENHAEEIVSFKNGYFLTQPAQYISRNAKSQRKVNKLNEFLYRSGKAHADNKVVDWFHTVGVGVLYIEPNNDENVPVKVYALDPRNAFVVYSMRPGNKPLIGINCVMNDRHLIVDAYTENAVYRLDGTVNAPFVLANKQNYQAAATRLISVEKNVLGAIPIIEYFNQTTKMGAFEPVLGLLNALDRIASNRLDGIEQFIQSLMVIYGADLPEGSETAEDMKRKGILVLPNDGEGGRSDVKILSSELNQQQTQSLVDWIYQTVLTICAMPSTTKGGSSTSDTGAAVIYRDGWAQADMYARNTEDLFKESNSRFDQIFIKILKQKNLLDISDTDFELNFVRNETSGVYTKSQSLLNLLTAGVAPELAFAKSGISNDPVNDVKMSEKWLNAKWGNPTETKPAEQNGQGQENESGAEPNIKGLTERKLTSQTGEPQGG